MKLSGNLRNNRLFWVHAEAIERDVEREASLWSLGTYKKPSGEEGLPSSQHLDPTSPIMQALKNPSCLVWEPEVQAEVL